jgi:plasmid stabilization system protein ParE
VIHRLIVAPQAEADLRDAFLWYEQKSAGLGHDFLQRADTKLDQIARSPQLFRLRHGRSRLAPTERFPYAIYFIWDESRQVVSVLRVLHFKQDSRPRV